MRVSVCDFVSVFTGWSVCACVRACTCVRKNKSKREIVTLKMVISILSLNFTFFLLLPVFKFNLSRFFFHSLVLLLFESLIAR